MTSVNKDSLENKVSLAANLYVSDKKSIPDIANILDWPRSKVRTCLIKNGTTLRSRKEGLEAAKHKIGKHMLGKKRIFNDTWKKNMSDSAIKRGELLSAGVSFKTGGYAEYTRGENKGRCVHVIAMELRLGRKLMPDEIVHHIDGDKHNNDINNLALMTRSAHARLHRREENITRRIK
ncbi:MAG: HNH endonuclease [Nitrosomonas sp.]|nr:HNH endonuclease [Nitrosomonas sp.]